MTNNDVFSPKVTDEQIAVPDVFYGEVVVLRGYHGIRLYDLDESKKGWQEYDSNDELHKRAIATPQKNGKQRRTHIIYEFQHFPIGAKFPTYPIQSPNWSDDFIIFAKSLCDMHGLDSAVTDRLPKAEWTDQRIEDYKVFMNELKKLTDGNNFFKYETPVIRTYKKADGKTANVRGIKLLEKYDTQETCQTAYEAQHSKIKNDVPGFEPETVNVMDKTTALAFVKPLAEQCRQADNKIDRDMLAAKMAELPPLKNLSIDTPEVAAIIDELEKDAPW